MKQKQYNYIIFGFFLLNIVCAYYLCIYRIEIGNLQYLIERKNHFIDEEKKKKEDWKNSFFSLFENDGLCLNGIELVDFWDNKMSNNSNNNILKHKILFFINLDDVSHKKYYEYVMKYFLERFSSDYYQQIFLFKQFKRHRMNAIDLVSKDSVIFTNSNNLESITLNNCALVYTNQDGDIVTTYLITKETFQYVGRFFEQIDVSFMLNNQ